MPTLVKSIGTSSRDYATVTLWESDLDSANYYASGDIAQGEMYDDSAFDESATINGGATIGLNSIVLTVPLAERHSGTAGTGVRFVKTAATTALTLSNASGRPLTCEWIEFNMGSLATNNAITHGAGSGQSTTIRYCLVHEINGQLSANGTISCTSARSCNCVRSGCIVHDGSLPSTTGFEINTAPASGSQWVAQITDITEALALANAQVTYVCGLHVHVDVTQWVKPNLNTSALQKLITLYSAVEDGLFGLVPDVRRDSHYAERCGESYSGVMEKLTRGGTITTREQKRKYRALLKSVIHEAVYPTRAPMDVERPTRESRILQAQTDAAGLRRRKHHKWETTRYRALNLHSVFYRGTVECRLYPGTIERTAIIAWGNLWADIIDYCSETPLHVIQAEAIYPGYYSYRFRPRVYVGPGTYYWGGHRHY